MDGSTFVAELKKRVGELSVQGPAEELSGDKLPSEVDSHRPLVLEMAGENKGIKAFANYIAESSRQQMRVSLLKSCFLGKQEQMKHALQVKHVNDEMQIPFYSWEYVIVFENPDFPSHAKQKGVTQRVAESHFNTCFQGEAGDLKYQQDINRQFERTAFLTAFAELPESDFVDQKWKYIRFSSDEKRKARNKGGQLKPEDGQWVVQSTQPRDYMTFIRNVVQTKLSLHVGLKTRLMLSASGEYIYMLVLADECDLQNEAERVNFHMQLELGATDMISLEPCDTNLRPLSKVKKDGFEGLLREIASLEAELYQEVRYAIADEPQEYVKLDPEGVGPGEWVTYREFLEYIRDDLKKLRDENLPAHMAFRRHHSIMLAAYKAVNAAHPKAPLYSLWDRLSVPTPMAAFSRYLRDIDPVTHKDILSHYWCRYRLDSPSSETLFSSADRVKLIDSMIMSQVNVKRLEKLRLVKTHFPLHRIWEIERSLCLPPQLLSVEGESELNLKLQWRPSWTRLEQPLDLIREYYGEKIGFFFLYLQTYTAWILPLSVFGVLFLLGQVFNLDKATSFEINELYCFLTIAWSSVFLEMWKRKQEKFAIKWGQSTFEEVEIQRPEFRGKLRRSPVNDDLYELYYDSGKRLLYQALGFLISFMFVTLTMFTIALILYERYVVRAAGGIIWMGYEFSGTLFGFLNALQIEVFNRLFEKIAMKTTELENYKLQSDFENSYITKSFMYQMVNCYASIVYVAFFQAHFEGCYVLLSDGTKQTYSCMYDLQVQLATIYFTHFLYNLVIITRGKFDGLRGRAKEQEQEAALKRSWQEDIHNPQTLRYQLDREFSKESYLANSIDGTFADYLELMIQYGYITLFAVAFPLTPLIALFNNIYDLRVNRFKMLSLTRRPVPASTKGIGRWLTVLDVMTMMSVFTNSALLCFTLDAFNDWDMMPGEPIMWFAIMLSSIYVMRKAVALVIPDVPHRYILVKKRHNVIIEKHIKKFKPTKRALSIDSEWVNMTVVGTV